MSMQTVTFDADLYKLMPIEPKAEYIRKLARAWGYTFEEAYYTYKEMLVVSPPINTEVE